MGELFLRILKLNVLAALVILAALGLSRVLEKKYSSRWKYLTWLFTAFFLLVPVQIPGAHKVLELEVPQHMIRLPQLPEKEQSGGEGKQDVPPSPSEQEGISTDAAMAANSGAGQTDNSGQGSGVPSKESLPSGMLPGEKQGSRQIPVLTLLAAAWLAGACVLGLSRVIACYNSMRNLRRWSVPMTNREILYEYRRICHQMGIRRAPRLMVNESLYSPLLCGLRVPGLYLPRETYTKEERSFIFRHELSHYRNRDLWYKLLLMTVTTVYWFNPALYLMRRESEKDIEYLCDERVVKGKNKEERLGYNKLLIRTAATGNVGYELAASMNDGLMDFKKRMANIMYSGRLKRGSVPVAALLAVLLTVNLSTGCTLAVTGLDSADGSSFSNGALQPSPLPETESLPLPENQTQDGAENGQGIEQMELSSEMSEEKIPALAATLQLQEARGAIFGENGVAYEGEGIRIEYLPTEGEYLAPISVKGTGAPLVTMEGIYCGQSFEDAKRQLRRNNWHPFRGSEIENSVSMYRADNNSSYMLMLQQSEEDATVGEWYWCNWPEGEFEINFCPAEGVYQNGAWKENSENIRVEAIDEKSFQFSIYHGDELIFKPHTAVFENGTSPVAVYRGQKYTLYFDCSSYDRIVMTGFDEATPYGEHTFINYALTE